MVMLTRGVCLAIPGFFAIAFEDEDRISFGDVLATVHRLLSIERERLR